MRDEDLIQLWQLYQANITNHRQYSLRDLGLAVGTPTDRHFVSSEPSTDAAKSRVEQLLGAWQNSALARMSATGSEIMEDEQKLIELSMEFLLTADAVRPARFNELLDLGIPVNFQHPAYLETALHITCSRNAANGLTRVLLEHPQIDLLLRDQFGRRAWNNAVFFRLEQPLADTVTAATIKQAALENQTEADFHQEYREDLAKWITTDWYASLARSRGDVWSPEY
ncbi:Uncharacterised protein [Halioglobus japonicus]|nr:Uncharacterised protein [Halioglobus japonicus]